MNPAYLKDYLERREKAEDIDRVGSVEHLLFQLYFETSCHLGNSVCRLVIVLLGPVRQVIAMVVQLCPGVVFLDRLYYEYRLFRQRETPVAVRIGRMTTTVASTLERIVRCGARFE